MFPLPSALVASFSDSIFGSRAHAFKIRVSHGNVRRQTLARVADEKMLSTGERGINSYYLEQHLRTKQFPTFTITCNKSLPFADNFGTTCEKVMEGW